MIYFKVVRFKEMRILEWKRKILRLKDNHMQADWLCLHKWGLMHQNTAV